MGGELGKEPRGGKEADSWERGGELGKIDKVVERDWYG
jgi:hypothetical protein